MKYMEGGGFQNHPLMRLTIGLTLVLLMAFWVTNLGLYFSKMGFDPASVVAYYNGSEEEFRPARTLGSMLEVTHAHLLMKALVMLLLTHLVIFAPFRRTTRLIFIWSGFGAALMDELGGWLVRFVSPAAAPVKVVGFVALEVVLAMLILCLGFTLLMVPRRSQAMQVHNGLVAGEKPSGSERVLVGAQAREPNS